MRRANRVIRKAAGVAFAYIPPRDRADWLRGWRQTARGVSSSCLMGRLDRHIANLRMREDNSNPRVIN
jgi:hypothetical protein